MILQPGGWCMSKGPSTLRLGGAVQMNKHFAVREMIDGAMGAHESGRYAISVTLAAAAEGAMPHPRSPSLFELSKDARHGYVTSKEIVAYLNEARDWLKHHNADHPEAMEINESISLFYILRAMSKFQNLYGFDAETATMKEFFAIARQFQRGD